MAACPPTTTNHLADDIPEGLNGMFAFQTTSMREFDVSLETVNARRAGPENKLVIVQQRSRMRWRCRSTVMAYTPPRRPHATGEEIHRNAETQVLNGLHPEHAGKGERHAKPQSPTPNGNASGVCRLRRRFHPAGGPIRSRDDNSHQGEENRRCNIKSGHREHGHFALNELLRAGPLSSR